MSTGPPFLVATVGTPCAAAYISRNTISTRSRARQKWARHAQQLTQVGTQSDTEADQYHVLQPE